MEGLSRNSSDPMDKLREDIELTKKQITESIREIRERPTSEALWRAAAAKGSKLIGEKVQPFVNGTGDTMKEMLGKVLDAVNRDPLPVLMMGAEAGLVLLSLYNRKEVTGEQPPGPQPAGADPYGEPEEIGDSEREKARSESFNKIALGLSALVLGAVMSGVVPGVDSDKVEEWKSDLLTKAGEAGEELLKSTEKMLREKFSQETIDKGNESFQI